MPTPRHTLRNLGRAQLGALTLAATLLTACQPVRMGLPEGLSAAEGMTVSGRQGLMTRQQVRFGPYETHELKRSWTRGRDRGGSTATQSERRQSYSFKLRQGERDQWFVACHASAQATTLTFGSISAQSADESGVYCNLQSLQSPSIAWELTLQQRTQERFLVGTLSLPGTEMEVKGTSRTQRKLSLGTPTGYEFHEAGEVIAAVEVIQAGTVWLRPDQSPERHSLLSAASTALLLLEDLYDTMRN